MSPSRIARSGDPFDQALLRAGRNDGPPRGAEDRALAGLGLATSLAAGSAIAAHPGALSAARWGGSLKLLAVVMALGAGVWLGASRGTVFARWEREHRAYAPVAPSVASPAEPIATVGLPGPSAAAENPSLPKPLEPGVPALGAVGSSPTPLVVDATNAARAAVRHAPRLSSAPSAPTGAGAARADGDTATSAPVDAAPLSIEIALVQQAARALVSGEVSVVFGLLDAYDRQCAHGVLAEEAGTLRVRALAQSGRATEAKALARKLLDAHPHGVLAARLEAVLDGASDAGHATSDAGRR